jgi:hypothetical protein
LGKTRRVEVGLVFFYSTRRVERNPTGLVQWDSRSCVRHWVFSVHYSFDVQNFEHRTPINSLSAYGVKR